MSESGMSLLVLENWHFKIKTFRHVDVVLNRVDRQ